MCPRSTKINLARRDLRERRLREDIAKELAAQEKLWRHTRIHFAPLHWPHPANIAAAATSSAIAIIPPCGFVVCFEILLFVQVRVVVIDFAVVDGNSIHCEGS